MAPPTQRLQLVRGGRAAMVVRHTPFVTSERRGPQYNSNRINAEGFFRREACSSCLAAIANFARPIRGPSRHLDANDSQDRRFLTGRGASTHNEVFSCMVHRSLGNGGVQCGRCIGLGTGTSCAGPPEALYAEASAVVRAAAGYNRVLTKNAEIPYSQWTVDEQAAVDAAVKASRDYSEALRGLKRREGPAAGGTPAKRQRLMDVDDTPSKRDIEQVLAKSTLIESDMAKSGQAQNSMAKHVRHLRRDMDTVLRLLRVSRERERWLVEAVQGLLDTHNRAAEEGEHIYVESLRLEERGYETEDPMATALADPEEDDE
ncbi:hypothetical protein F5884DRAFT_758897 [Xylogone sp. PMI_703]|nr:hypothetical protein F5884DRAFT_758897 [Xylogone sp. PMI_703]